VSGTEATRDALGERISYAQSWEDPRVLQAGLQVGSDDRVLSVCAAGDNSFALAIAGAESVTAIDLSAPQIALAKLKLAAAVALDVERFRSFLGVGPIGQRVFLYHEIRPSLDEDVRAYWDANEEWIRLGVIGCGRFEQYLATFRTRLLPLVHRKSTIEQFLACQTVDEQRRFYDAHWNTWRWRSLFRLFFSRTVMQRSGRSAAQFAHVDGPVSAAFLKRVEYGMCALPIATNPFLQWMLAGKYTDPENSQPYLSEQGHSALVDAADRIRFVHSDLMTHLQASTAGTYTAFNYSDVPEYLSEAETQSLLAATADASQSGGRIAYWNLLVPRHRPDALADRLTRNEALGTRLLATDRAFVYGGFQVETVR